MRAKAQLIGERGMQRAFDRLEGKVQKRIVRTAQRTVLRRMLRTAKSLVPRAASELFRSLKVRATKRSRKRIGVQMMAGGDRAPHAFHVETGTKNSPANPFFRSAWDQHVDTLERDLVDEFDKGLKDAWGGR